ncbi:MAG: hypothetical protein ABSF67_04355 [Roseiarcus sp.]
MQSLSEELDAATANYESAQDKEFEAAYKKAKGVVERIVAAPATTIEGLRVKAHALAWCYSFEPIEFVAAFGDTTDVLVLASIVRDLLAPSAGLGAVDLAIAAHRSLQATVEAMESAAEEDSFAAAIAAESKALRDVAKTRCATDAEFVAKAAYLVACERKQWGSPPSDQEPFGLLAMATELHMRGRTPAL